MYTRVLVALAVVLVQGADNDMAKGAASAQAVLPMGKAPVAMSVLMNTDWKSPAKPKWLASLQMPVAPAGVVSTVAPKVDLSARMKSDMKQSGVLKAALAEVKKKDPKITEDQLADFVEEGVRNALNGKDTKDVAGPGRRLLGFWQDIECGLFSGPAVLGYLAAYAYFHACNGGYVKLTPHQKYFQRSIFGTNILDPVNVKYSACFPPGFGSAAATTMGKEIYVRAAASTSDTNSEFTMSVSGAFKSQTQLLIHELGHSKQYADRGWNVAEFAWDYMWEYCQADYSYSGNKMEKQAESFRFLTEQLFQGGAQPVVAHFKKWRQDNLAALGFPKNQKEWTNFQIAGTNIMSLNMTNAANGAVSAESQRKSGTACVRVLTGSQMSATNRKLANVPGKPWDCTNLPPSKAPTKAPTKKPTNPPSPIVLSPAIVQIPTVRPPTFKIPA